MVYNLLMLFLLLFEACLFLILSFLFQIIYPEFSEMLLFSLYGSPKILHNNKAVKEYIILCMLVGHILSSYLEYCNAIKIT